VIRDAGGGGGGDSHDAGQGDAGRLAEVDAGREPTVVKPVAAGGASKVSDATASDGFSIALANTGQGAEADDLPPSSAVAIRYASTSVGTISVAVNGQAGRKVNVHSSGALVGSFLYAKFDIAVPDHGKVTITRAAGDVAVNVDRSSSAMESCGCRRTSGTSRSSGGGCAYPADWKGLGLAYVAPEWWREAKFGAWAHWDHSQCQSRVTGTHARCIRKVIRCTRITSGHSAIRRSTATRTSARTGSLIAGSRRS